MTLREAEAFPWSAYTADAPLVLDYTNHAGKRSLRRVVPEASPLRLVRFAPEHRHGDDVGTLQWALRGICLTRGEPRDFRIDYIHEVRG